MAEEGIFFEDSSSTSDEPDILLNWVDFQEIITYPNIVSKRNISSYFKYALCEIDSTT